jgi:hypothetical protein
MGLATAATHAHNDDECIQKKEDRLLTNNIQENKLEHIGHTSSNDSAGD